MPRQHHGNRDVANHIVKVVRHSFSGWRDAARLCGQQELAMNGVGGRDEAGLCFSFYVFCLQIIKRAFFLKKFSIDPNNDHNTDKCRRFPFFLLYLSFPFKSNKHTRLIKLVTCLGWQLGRAGTGRPGRPNYQMGEAGSAQYVNWPHTGPWVGDRLWC